MRLVLAGLVFATLATGCKSKQCATKHVDRSPTSVRIEWGACADDNPHLIDCAMRGPDFTCSCNPGESFTLPLVKGAAPEITAAEAREGCKWDFTP